METPRRVPDLTQPIDPSADSKTLEQIVRNPDPLSRIGVFFSLPNSRLGGARKRSLDGGRLGASSGAPQVPPVTRQALKERLLNI